MATPLAYARGSDQSRDRKEAIKGSDVGQDGILRTDCQSVQPGAARPADRNAVAPYLCAVTVISMCAAGEASFTTPTVVRAGRGSAKYLV